MRAEHAFTSFIPYLRYIDTERFLLFFGVIATMMSSLRRPFDVRWERVLIGLLLLLLAFAIVSRVVNEAVIARWGAQDDWNMSIAAAAGAWLNGQPLYPAPESGSYYGLLYGPLLFECVALGQRWFGIAAPAASLSVMLAEAAAVAIMGVALYRLGLSRPTTVICMAICVVFDGVYYTHVGERGEPLLLLCAALALSTLRGLEEGRMGSGLLLGLYGGLATAIKLSAPCYAGPLLIAAFLKGGRARSATLAVPLGFVLGFTAPYLLPGVGLAAHLHFIAGLYRFPVFPSHIIGNVIFVVAYALPLVLWRPGLEAGSERRIAIGLCVSAPPIVFVASIEGAWNWHFLPFAPPYLFLLGRVIDGTRIDNWRRVVLTMPMLALAIVAINRNLSSAEGNRRASLGVVSTRLDVDAFLARHPGETVAIADTKGGLNAWAIQSQIVRLVQSGQPLLFTNFAWTDMRRAENVERLIAHTFTGCRVRYWLSRTDEPFVAVNYDARIPLAFHDHYALMGQNRSFFIWACREASP